MLNKPMVDATQVRLIALAMSGVSDDSSQEQIILSWQGRGIAWTFMQRDAPKQPRWPNPDVLAISCTLDHKELLLEAAPDVYFDDDHYRGYPAVLVRRPNITPEDLSHLLATACALQAAKPKRRKKTT